MAYDVIDVNELEGEGPGGMVRKARRAVGASAFGFNYFTFPPETGGPRAQPLGNGHEEVYVAIRGSGVMRVDGADVEMKPRRFIRVDPGSTRMPTSGPDGLEFITFGGPQNGATSRRTGDNLPHADHTGTRPTTSWCCCARLCTRTWTTSGTRKRTCCGGSRS